MNQKYQNTYVFIGLCLLLLLLPLLLTAQEQIGTQKWSSADIRLEVERASLQELFQANPDALFSADWKALTTQSFCEICQFEEVDCTDKGFVSALHLAGIKLKVLPASIHNLKSLEALFLEENALPELPMTLGNMTQLQELRISNNAIQHLAEPLRNLCGVNVGKGLLGNPIAKKISWEEFCRGI